MASATPSRSSGVSLGYDATSKAAPPLSSNVLKVCPEDGLAYTLAELSEAYQGSLGSEEILDYWKLKCVVALPGAKRASQARLANAERRVDPNDGGVYLSRRAPPSSVASMPPATTRSPPPLLRSRTEAESSSAPADGKRAPRDGHQAKMDPDDGQVYKSYAEFEAACRDDFSQAEILDYWHTSMVPAPSPSIARSAADTPTTSGATGDSGGARAKVDRAGAWVDPSGEGLKKWLEEVDSEWLRLTPGVFLPDGRGVQSQFRALEKEFGSFDGLVSGFKRVRGDAIREAALFESAGVRRLCHRRLLVRGLARLV